MRTHKHKHYNTITYPHPPPLLPRFIRQCNARYALALRHAVPDDLATAAKKWKQALTEEGAVYFYHTVTGERRWDKPREFLLAEQEVLDRQRRQEQAERREQLEKFPQRLQRLVL